MIFYCIKQSNNKLKISTSSSPMNNTSSAELLLTIFNLNISVKFPCTLALHHEGNPISTEVQSVNGVFNVNQNATLKVSQSNLEINVYLSTDKGSSILAGIISAPLHALTGKEGQRLSFPLQKCIDTAAVCEIKVHQVQFSQQNPQNKTKSSSGGFMLRSHSPDSPVKKMNPRISGYSDETCSEFKGNMLRRRINTTMNYQREMNQAKRTHLPRFHKEDFGSAHLQNELGETRTMNGSVLRRKQRERQKLVSKKAAEEAENNYKMDLSRWRMKTEELENTVEEKSKTIKLLKEQVLQCQRKIIEKSYIEEQLNSQENTIKMLEERISNLTAQNSELREDITEHLKTINELRENIRFELLKNKQEFEKREQQMRAELTGLKNTAAQLELDLQMKLSQVSKAQKYIHELENNAQNKIFEHETLTQLLKKQNKRNVEILESKIVELEACSSQASQEIGEKNAMIQSLSHKLNEAEQAQRYQEQTVLDLQHEKMQLQFLKTDMLSLTQKCSELEETLKLENKTAKKKMDARNKQYTNLELEATKTAKALQSKIAQQSEHSQQQKLRLVELENTIIHYKEEQQKSKRSADKLEKTVNDWQSKYNTLEQQYRVLETRLQNQEKQLSKRNSGSQHTQSLLQMQLKHSKQLNSNLIKQCEDYSAKYSQTKEQLELIINQKNKLINKSQLLQENIHRLNENMRERKQAWEAKFDELQQQLRNGNLKIKEIADILSKKDQEINAWKIKELKYQNKIEKGQKQLEESNKKMETLVPKLAEDKQRLQKELESAKAKLQQSLDENRQIVEEKSKLKSQTHKNSQINNVLSEEKTLTNKSMENMKSVITQSKRQQLKLSEELKLAYQENKKLSAKIEGMQSESSKVKETLNDTVNNMMTLKQFINATNTNSPKIQILRHSRMITSNKSIGSREKLASSSESFELKKMIQLINCISREQHQSIINLQEHLRNCKQETGRLQSELASITEAARSGELKRNELIIEIQNELEQAQQKLMRVSNDYEDKLSQLENELSKREKELKLQQTTMKALKSELETYKKKMDLIVDEKNHNENNAQDRLQEMASQLSFFEHHLQNLEHEKREVEEKLYRLEQESHREQSQGLRRERHVHEITEKYTLLLAEHEEEGKASKKLLEKLLTLEGELEAVKQDHQKTKQMLQNQEDSHRKSQQLSNQLLKQKQSLVKAELESSARTIELQQSLAQLKNQLHTMDELTVEKQRQISGLKNTVKHLQTQNKDAKNDLMEQNNAIAELTSKCQQQQIKMQELKVQIEDITSISEASIHQLRSQLKEKEMTNQKLQEQSLKMREEKDAKLHKLESDNTDLHSQINMLRVEKQHNEEQIFFEKQKTTLNGSKMNDMNKQMSEMGLAITNYKQELKELTQELATKEEALFEYYDKVFRLEQEVGKARSESRAHAEKVDIDWQCRHDEICEEYEQKIELLEKDKQYLRDKLALMEKSHQKLQLQKKSETELSEKEIGSYRSRQKQMEGERLQKLASKNKQLERAKAEISMLRDQLKNIKAQVTNKRNQIIAKQSAISSLESKILENEKIASLKVHSLQNQIEQLKQGEVALRAYKERMRNSQWTAEREVRRVSQVFISNVLNCCPQVKQHLNEPIRALQSSIASAINFQV